MIFSWMKTPILAAEEKASALQLRRDEDEERPPWSNGNAMDKGEGIAISRTLKGTLRTWSQTIGYSPHFLLSLCAH